MGQPWIAPDTPSEPARLIDQRAPVLTTARLNRRRGLPNSPVERLQPSGLAAILDGGFEVMRFRFPTIAALSAIIVLPLAGIPAFVAQFNLAHRLDDIRSAPAIRYGFGLSNAQTFQSLLSSLGGALALALVGVGVAHLVTGWLLGEDRTLGGTLRHVAVRSWVIVIAWLVVLPLKAVGLVACLVGTIFVLGAFLPLSAVVSAEGLGPFASIKRCWRLTSKRLGFLFGLVCISFLLNLALGLIISLVVFVFQNAVLSGGRWSWAVSAGVTTAFRLVLVPVQAAWAALAYLDLRVRTEGLDIELESVAVFGEGPRG